MTRIINGKKQALTKEKSFKKIVKDKQLKLKLAIVVFENDKAGKLYSKLKQEICERIGIDFLKFEVKSDKKAGKIIKDLNQDKTVTGIVVQYPGRKLVKKLDIQWDNLITLINQSKDVDGLRSDSLFEQATVKAVFKLIDNLAPDREENCLYVVGARGFVGSRLMDKLKKEGYRVRGLDLGGDFYQLKQADVVVSATGRENLIGPRMIKKGAVVIDVGWPRGDVQFDKVKKKAGMITPVPGGVGPLTVVSLLENLIKAGYTNG